MSGNKPRNKGKRGERKARVICNDLGWDAVRGLTQCDSGRGSDVIATTAFGLKLGIEVKSYARHPSAKILGWREQAERGCDEGMAPMLIELWDRREPWVSMPVSTLRRIVEASRCE